jgi:PAS domain S-box-containing protein
MPDRGHVFIIDEDRHNVDVLRDLLERNGYAVRWTASGTDARAAIPAADTNLVLLDAHVSDVDAFALCNELKQHRETAFIPVMFMTAAGDAEARVRGVELGDDLITRPFETREVLARVERQVTVSKVRMALRESEAKFQSVMESAIDAIISGDVSGRIRSWNSAATVLFGFTEKEALGQPIELIIPERFRARHQEGLHRVAAGGPHHVIGRTVELAALHKSGHEFPVELSLATWFLDDERYFTGIIRDISERKQAEQKFRSVTESAYDAIISADHTGRIISWNNAATRILGYTREEAVDRQLELIIPERFHEPHREGMQRVTEGGESRVIGRTVELFARTKQGDEVPIELSLSTWAVREERYYTGIIRDIRERKEAEETLRLSEQRLRASALELKKKNDALEQTLNRLQEMQNQLIMQEKMASLGRPSAGMAHELNNPAAAAQRSAAHLDGTFHRLQDTLLSIGGLNLGDAQLDQALALGQFAEGRAADTGAIDAVDRSGKESELEEWLEARGIGKAWEVAPALVELGYDRHGLRELTDRFTDDQLAVVLDWLTCAHIIRSLIAELSLATGRISAIVGALKMYTYMDQASIQAVDLRQGLDNTLIILENRLKDGVAVRREYVDDLPSIQAHGGELNQVWTNIIENAIDAMSGAGTLVVRTYVEDPWAVVEIEDDGPGIPNEARDKIFDPFFTTKAPGEGTGLGLTVSHNVIVQKHRGQMAVSSEPGRTRFTVRLPLRPQPAEVSSPDEPR